MYLQIRKLTLIFFLTFYFSCQSQSSKQTQSAPTKPSSKQMDTHDLIPEYAHPKAKALLTEEFYWSPIEETGPFGSDDGSDSFAGFQRWRPTNKMNSPLIYLKELVNGWGYKTFDWYEMDTIKIKEYISTDAIAGAMLIGQDNAIIAVGFGQFVLEGQIDQDIQDLTKTAITRELNSVLLRQFRDDYHEKRKSQLNKMLLSLDKMNK